MNKISLYIALLLPLWLLSIGSAYASSWYLVAVENSASHEAIVAHRIESTLINIKNELALVWVRQDYIRPSNYKYPKDPVSGSGEWTGILNTAMLWEKNLYTLDCSNQKIIKSEGSIKVFGEKFPRPWEMTKANIVRPDTAEEIIFKLFCINGKTQSIEKIRNSIMLLEKLLIPDKKKRKPIRDEKKVPKLLVNSSPTSALKSLASQASTPKIGAAY